MRSKTFLGAIGLSLTVALTATACGGNGNDDTADAVGAGASGTTAPASVTSATGASTLRAGLTGLLTEHIYLAALATGAALRGDEKAFASWADALNGPTRSNSADVVAAVTSAYGDEVGKAFNGLWRSEDHIPAFVRYTQAVAKGDKAGQNKAVADLTAYAKTFGTTMNSVNENLPADAVTQAITTHVTTLKAVVDAQKAGNQATVYQSLRTAYHHMGDTAKVLAVATAQKFPEKFDGDAASKAADVRSGLTALLREHVLLASSATGGALAGRTKQFEAAATALNGADGSNSTDVVGAVTGIYGAEVGKAFDGLWRSEDHIPAFVAYTQAVAKGDKAGQTKALDDLKAYAQTFGTTMNSVNENLPAAAVAEAITMHATTLKAVIDAQGAKNPAQVAALTREAVHHMSGTADVLAEATVKKFPEKF